MGYVDGVSLYRYLSNSPQSSLDSLGLYWEKIERVNESTLWTLKTTDAISIENKKCGECYLVVTQKTWEERYMLTKEIHTFGYYGNSVMSTGKTTASVGGGVAAVGLIMTSSIVGIPEGAGVAAVGAGISAAGAATWLAGGFIYATDWFTSRGSKPSNYTKILTANREIRNYQEYVKYKIKIDCSSIKK